MYQSDVIFRVFAEAAKSDWQADIKTQKSWLRAGKRRAAKWCFIDPDVLSPFTEGEYSWVMMQEKPCPCLGQQKGGLSAAAMVKAWLREKYRDELQEVLATREFLGLNEMIEVLLARSCLKSWSFVCQLLVWLYQLPWSKKMFDSDLFSCRKA